MSSRRRGCRLANHSIAFVRDSGQRCYRQPHSVAVRDGPSPMLGRRSLRLIARASVCHTRWTRSKGLRRGNLDSTVQRFEKCHTMGRIASHLGTVICAPCRARQSNLSQVRFQVSELITLSVAHAARQACSCDVTPSRVCQEHCGLRSHCLGAKKRRSHRDVSCVAESSDCLKSESFTKSQPNVGVGHQQPCGERITMSFDLPISRRSECDHLGRDKINGGSTLKDQMGDFMRPGKSFSRVRQCLPKGDHRLAIYVVQASELFDMHSTY